MTSPDPGRRPAISPRPGVICAVVVTFHPDDGLAERLARVRTQVGAIVIVDNSTAAASRERVRAAASPLGAELLANDGNAGVAAALNRGIERAADRGFAWVLCLDQDTVAFSSMVHTLVDAYRSCPDRERVGIVGSRWVGDLTHRDPCDGSAWAPREDVITSGSLLPVAAFRDVGGFREDFFIDYVDVEWCFRLREQGYATIVACPPTMFHSVGAPRRHRFVYRDVMTTHHDPIRRYYITRNRLVVWRRYARTERRFVSMDVRNLAKETAKVLLFERDRGAKLRAVLRGIRDGLLERTGERHAPGR